MYDGTLAEDINTKNSQTLGSQTHSKPENRQ